MFGTEIIPKKPGRVMLPRETAKIANYGNTPDGTLKQGLIGIFYFKAIINN
jgi:hypothetical protein